MKDSNVIFRKRLVPLVTVGLLVLAASLVLGAPPDEWLNLSPAEFAQRDDAQQTMDAAHLDQSLLSAAIFHETNRMRTAQNLPALRYDAQLEAAATMHADDMTREDFFAHENPNDPTRHEPIDRIRLAGYDPRFCAENLITAFDYDYESGKAFYIVDGQPSYSPDGPPLPRFTYQKFAESVVDRWMHSEGHRANILSAHAEEIGIHTTPAAEAENSMTELISVQNFGTKMPADAKRAK